MRRQLGGEFLVRCELFAFFSIEFIDIETPKQSLDRAVEIDVVHQLVTEQCACTAIDDPFLLMSMDWSSSWPEGGAFFCRAGPTKPTHRGGVSFTIAVVGCHRFDPFCKPRVQLVCRAEFESDQICNPSSNRNSLTVCFMYARGNKQCQRNLCLQLELQLRP